MFRASHLPSLLMIALSICALGKAEVAHAQQYSVGLDFLDTPKSLPGFPYIVSLEPFETDDVYDTCQLTDPAYKGILDGGLLGWTEQGARLGVTRAVESVFRNVDVGDPSMTLSLAIAPGMVPGDLGEIRFNVAIGKDDHVADTLLGQARQGEYAERPMDSHLAVVHLDNIYGLTDLELTSPEFVFNAIGGTVAHEIGHVFGLDHIARGQECPYPIMATGSYVEDPLENWDRVTVRHFTPYNEILLSSVIGTVKRADFDFDGDVDYVGGFGEISDLEILIANVGSQNAFMFQGDADNDGDVDYAGGFGEGSDLELLIANVTGAADLGADAKSGTAEMLYDPTTGEVSLDVGAGVVNIKLQLNPSLGEIDIAAVGDLLGKAPTVNDGTSLTFFDNGGLPVGEDSVGMVLPTGMEMINGQTVIFEYQVTGSDPTRGEITVVPEPMTMSLLAIGGLAMIRRRRK